MNAWVREEEARGKASLKFEATMTTSLILLLIMLQFVDYVLNNWDPFVVVMLCIRSRRKNLRKVNCSKTYLLNALNSCSVCFFLAYLIVHIKAWFLKWDQPNQCVSSFFFLSGSFPRILVLCYFHLYLIFPTISFCR